jgi:hypothetical protein
VKVRTVESHGSAVGITTDYGAGRSRGLSSNPGRVKKFRYSIRCRPALRHTQPPVLWVQGELFSGKAARGVKLTTHVQLVPRSRKQESVNQLSSTFSWGNESLPDYTASHPDVTKKKTPWSSSASKYTDRRLSAKWLPLLRIEGATWPACGSLRPYSRFSRQEPLLFY